MSKPASPFEIVTRVLFALALLVLAGIAAALGWVWIFGCGACAL